MLPEVGQEVGGGGFSRETGKAHGRKKEKDERGAMQFLIWVSLGNQTARTHARATRNDVPVEPPPNLRC